MTIENLTLPAYDGTLEHFDRVHALAENLVLSGDDEGLVELLRQCALPGVDRGTQRTVLIALKPLRKLPFLVEPLEQVAAQLRASSTHGLA